MSTRNLVGICALVILVATGALIFKRNADSAQAEMGRVDNGGAMRPYSDMSRGQWIPACPEGTAMAKKAIIAQLQAFKANDYVTAAKYQAAQLPPTPAAAANFRSIMRRDYPEFANFKSITFQAATEDSSGTTIRIPAVVTGADGVTVKATYLMQLERGSLLVAGVSGGLRSLARHGSADQCPSEVQPSRI